MYRKVYLCRRLQHLTNLFVLERFGLIMHLSRRQSLFVAPIVGVLEINSTSTLMTSSRMNGADPLLPRYRAQCRSDVTNCDDANRHSSVVRLADVLACLRVSLAAHHYVAAQEQLPKVCFV